MEKNKVGNSVNATRFPQNMQTLQTYNSENDYHIKFIFYMVVDKCNVVVYWSFPFCL